jgi:hypothetical protein
MSGQQPMRPKLYLETTIPGTLAARSGRDLIRAARQHHSRVVEHERSRVCAATDLHAGRANGGLMPCQSTA